MTHGVSLQAETDWVNLTKAGHQIAFNKLVDKYQKPVYNLCYRMLQDTAEAEDATQETFIRAYYKLDGYDEKHKFSTWLYSIASNHCIDRLRKRRITLISWGDLSPWNYPAAPESAQPEKVLLQAEANQEVYNLLKTLSPDSRTAVILKYWHHMSYEEIAKTLDTTVSAVKSKLFRARKTMANRSVTVASASSTAKHKPKFSAQFALAAS